MVSIGATDPDADASEHPGRYLIEILEWDGVLHLQVSPESTPPEYRFQGGLLYVRGFYIEGRILAPPSDRGKTIRLTTLNITPDMDFSNANDLDVGKVYFRTEEGRFSDMEFTLCIPQDALAMAVNCLGSAWRYIHIWTRDRDKDTAAVSAFSFTRTIHENLDNWIGMQ
jgi:hypothetical protein